MQPFGDQISYSLMRQAMRQCELWPCVSSVRCVGDDLRFQCAEGMFALCRQRTAAQ